MKDWHVANSCQVLAVLLVLLVGHGHECDADMDSVAEALAVVALNISSSYLDSCLQPGAPAMPNATACTGSAMAINLRPKVSSAVATVLSKQSSDICGIDGDQLSLHVQLDSMAFTARITEAISVFNAEQSFARISLLPTPEPMDVHDVAYGPPTLAADGRWTDCVGRTMHEIHDYLSPSNRRISHYLYFRRDIFKTRNIEVPQTWEQLIAIVKLLNGTDIDADGDGHFGICFNADAYCGAPYVMMQIYLSMFMYGDPNSKSWTLDPKTLEPLVDNAAMKRSLEIYAELAKYNHPLASVGCQAGSQMFCSGQCAVTLNSDQFRQSNDPACTVAGNLGSAPPPGSSYVLHYKSDTLVPCTRSLCPHAVTSSADASVLVNHAPLSVPVLSVYTANPSLRTDAGTVIAAFSSHINHYYGAYNYACDEATVPGNATAAGNGGAGVFIPRTPLVDASPSFNLDPLVQLGYNEFDAQEFLQVSFEISQYGNRVLGTPVPGASYFRTLMGAAAINATLANASLAEIAATLSRKFAMVAMAYNNTPLYTQLFRFGVGYQENPIPTGSFNASTWKPGYTAGIASGAALIVLLVCGALVAIRHYHRKSRLSFLGKVLPPGVGPATTLLVTDIQGSTDLWEMVTDDVMEQALAVHQNTLQGLLDVHRGYESATEGDSFILAFHTLTDALQYAVAAQRALLQADWPPELLHLDDSAAPCFARTQPQSQDARLSRIVQSLQAGGLGSCASFRRGHEGKHRLHTAIGLVGRLKQLLQWRRPEPPQLQVTDHADWHRLWQTIDAETFESEQKEGSETTASKDEAVRAACSSRSCSFGWALSKAWTEDENKDMATDASQFTPTATAPSFHHSVAQPSRTHLIWRGLRVRMGLHSGLTDPIALTVNATSRRTQYSGSFAATAKHVCDSGHGGQILLSADAYALFGGPQPGNVSILHMGEHVLATDLPPQPLYQAVIPSLEARLHSFPPLRAKQMVYEGVLAAPVGTATVVFMNGGGVQLLMAWNAEVTRCALQLYHDRVQKVLSRHSGYLPELSDGLALAVFQRAEDAIKWALSVQKGLLLAPWPEELLSNELGEPVMTTAAIETEDGLTIEHQVLALRGLRLKVGIATGEVLDYISPATARIMYRGRVMNWAARISALATSGQVLCMDSTWQLVINARSPPEGIAAVSAGLHMLKGVKGPVHVQSCIYTSGFASGSSASVRGARRTSTMSYAVADLTSASMPRLLPAVAPSMLQAAVGSG